MRIIGEAWLAETYLLVSFGGEGWRLSGEMASGFGMENLTYTLVSASATMDSTSRRHIRSIINFLQPPET
jgi:hypothetical protein